MEKTIKLAYGRTGLDLRLPCDQFDITEINPLNPDSIADPQQAFIQAANNPIGAKPIRELVAASGKTDPSVVIVIADHTRPVPDHLLVPWIVEQLQVSDSQVSILIGTGTHRHSTDQEIITKLGTETAQRFRIINHDCIESELVHLGTSSCGGPCLLNKMYVDADIKIVTGFIEPHFFAGFSGGPKGVMPGVAGLDTVRHFHRNSLIADPSVSWGNLEDNALQAVCREMVAMCPPDLMVNVTLNLDKAITGFFIGHFIEAHRVGCQLALKEAMVEMPRRFPVVITTNSGYPLDQNFYQAVKGISAAARICEAGGHIIIVCACDAGLPHDGEFAEQLGQALSNQELLRQIMAAKKTRHDQWQIQSLLQIGQNATIHLYSGLSDKDQKLTRTQHCSNIFSTLSKIADEIDEKPLSIAILPRGPLTIPTCVTD